MFNIKNKVYIDTFRNFNSHNHKFIILDGGMLKHTTFGKPNAVGIGCAFHEDNISDLIATHFGGSLSNFYTYLNNESKLKIYFYDVNDYYTFFIHALLELEEGFSLNKTTTTNLLEKHEIAQLLHFGQQVDLQSLYETEKNVYQVIGTLYDKTAIGELPLELVVQLFHCGAIKEEQADVKIASISKSMLNAFVVGVLYKVCHTVARFPEVLKEFTGDDSIATLLDIKNAINENAFLTKILVNKVVDVDADLAYIQTLLNVVFALDPDVDVLSDKQDLEAYIELYTFNKITYFINKVNLFSESAFFSTKADKFNKLLILVSP